MGFVPDTGKIVFGVIGPVEGTNEMAKRKYRLPLLYSHSPFVGLLAEDMQELIRYFQENKIPKKYARLKKIKKEAEVELERMESSRQPAGRTLFAYTNDISLDVVRDREPWFEEAYKKAKKNAGF